MGSVSALRDARAAASPRRAASQPAWLNLPEINRRLAAAEPTGVVRWAAETFGDGLVLSTSFGIQSAVMLHLATRVVPGIPVIWVDTGYLHPETYRYAEELTRRLRLNLHVAQSPVSPARMEALQGRPWESRDPAALDRYERQRKLEPMRAALRELGATAWLAGLRAEQTRHRAALNRVSRQDGRVKIHPILRWTSRDVHRHLREHELPEHPLFAKGYATVGDWHASRPVTEADAHERDTRFHGLKQECGLHIPETPGTDESLDSSGL